MLDQLINADRELFLYLNNLGSEGWDPFWLMVTDKLYSIPLYALLLFVIYRSRGLQALLVSILVIVLMITFTDQFTNLIKNTVERTRPCRTDGVMEYMRFVAERCGRFGFFSGHSSNSMAAAIFSGLLLRPFYKNLIYFLIPWSMLLAYSRIYVGVHYPLDIICGMSFGMLTGYGFYRLCLYILKRRNISKF